MKELERGGILGDEPFDRAVLGDDWMAVFLKEALPHIRMMLLDRRSRGVEFSANEKALEGLLVQYDLRYEDQLGYVSGQRQVEEMDAETDRLRAAILEKVYAWQAHSVDARRGVVDHLADCADMLGPVDGAATAAAIDILMDNLPEKEP